MTLPWPILLETVEPMAAPAKIMGINYRYQLRLHVDTPKGIFEYLMLMPSQTIPANVPPYIQKQVKRFLA